MRSQVISESFTVAHVDVLYVAQQVNLDLQALSKAYPRLLSLDRAINLFNSCTTFLVNYAVSKIGYCVHDPKQSNLVYHELRYEVLYGGDVSAISPGGRRIGKGGHPIESIRIPDSAVFTPLVWWSSHMLGLSEAEQEQIVSGTGWTIPRLSTGFNGTYQGGAWSS